MFVKPFNCLVFSALVALGICTIGCSPLVNKNRADAEGNVRIHIFIYTKAFGELWIDDITLTPVDE